MPSNLRVDEYGTKECELIFSVFLTCGKVIVNETTAQDTHDFITKRLSAIKNQRNSGELEDLALVIGNTVTPIIYVFSTYLIIDGKSLGYALDKEISKVFLELAIMCKAVICCAYVPFWTAYAPESYLYRSSIPLAESTCGQTCQKTPKSHSVGDW